MDSSWTLWVIVGLVVLAVIVGLALASRKSQTADPGPAGPDVQPETPGDGMARPRPDLPGETDPANPTGR